jgi:tetratricopeptide (TPR) repeat protein
MIFLIAAAIAAAAPTAATAPSPCPNLVTSEAFVCRALAAQKAGDSSNAAAAFEQAAQASSDKSPATAGLWAAAGNLWIAAGDPAKAAVALDKALALPGLVAEQRGEALLDRARAAEAQNDLVTARTKLNEAAASIAKDPFYWYFSAALYLREQNGQAAQAAIGQALTLAPADPTILFEAGHVAEFSGDTVGARDYWQRALERDPSGPIGKAAQEALRMLPAPLTVKTN